MALISGTIPNLLNGVSQQAPASRLPSQCELQENFYSTTVDGLKKRPPTNHLASLLNTNPDYPFVHFYDRDGIEKYVVVVESGNLRVFNLNTGASMPIKTNGGAPSFAYVGGLTRPDKELRALTLADTTFILNRNVPVQSANVTQANSSYAVYVQIKGGNYAQTYAVSLGGISAQIVTPSAGGAGADLAIQTHAIAENLKTALLATGGIFGTYDIVRSRSILAIKRIDNAFFDAALGSADLNGLMALTTDKIQKFSDITPQAGQNRIVQVIGDVATGSDDYWVRYDQTSVGSPGVWVECAKPSIAKDLAPSTMPFALVRMVDTTGAITGTVGQIYFDFHEYTWASRGCGDDTTNPMPSFVGKQLQDIFLYRNRLGLLADTSVVLSRAGVFHDFFRSTNVALFDDDPIDVSASHPRVVKLRHAVPFNEELVVFGDTAQFVMSAEGAMTPRTVRFAAATEYAVDLNCKPLNAENLIYFAFNNGNYSGVREYYVDIENGVTKDGDTITSHVPRYLTGNPLRMAACLTEDVMLVCTDGARDSLFVYKWFWQGDDKLQSSWSKWTFGFSGEATTIKGFAAFGPTLYLVIGRGTKVFLETMRLDCPVDAGMQYTIHLDRRVNAATGSYDPVTDTTPLTIAWDATYADMAAVVMTTGGGYCLGQELKIVSKAGATLTFKGNIVGLPLMIGAKYTSRYHFSPAQIIGQNVTGGISAQSNGRLQVRTWRVNYKDTGYFKAEVTPLYCDTVANEFTGRVLGSSENLIGEFPLETGTFKFLVNARNDQAIVELVNASHFPSSFVSAEWEGTFHTKSRKV